ncbi:hypothetical protein A3207_02525 [Candidatus Methanomassiliicoccus intestinalis]|uniref:Uncharacterized protein n=1 Tax=Candidatus Methanomassiliicoccus intestinalis TaxID=1406512 RepID=A0A8J8PFD4_9ARCH|nr:MAG: hypothetical protein A3207_02525 [Candidatus Methanomassiliicoccus intestinalis]
MIEIGLTEIIVAVAIVIVVAALIKSVYSLIPPSIAAVLVWFVTEDITYTVISFIVTLVLTILFKH